MRNIKDKNILVTGGAGFIGSHLVDELLNKGARKVVVIDNFFVGKMENLKDAKENYDNLIIYKDDASDYGTMQAIVEKEEIEVVFNLATMALIYSFFNPFGAYNINVEIANVLMQLMKNNKFKTLIHSSSSEAYGSLKYSPMDEDHPLNPTTPYAAGKAAADLLITSFYNVFKWDITIIRPFNNYGPRQNDQALAAIIPLTAKRIREGEKPIIEGDGLQTRDFIYVKDTVRAFIMAYENENAIGETINLGSGIEHKIKDIIQEIAVYYDYKGDFEYKPERTADVKRLCASSKKAKEILGFEIEVPFEVGIKETLDWYKEREKVIEDKQIIKKRKEIYDKYLRILPTNELFFDRWEKAKYINAGEGTSVYDTSVLMGNLKIGKNCWIGPYTLLEGQTKNITLGDNVVISSGVYIYTHDSTKKRISNNILNQLEGDVIIEDFVQVGSNATILPNVKIGHHSVVSAYSLVKKEVPPYSIVAGIPATIIGRVEIHKEDIIFKYFSKMEEAEINDNSYIKNNDKNLKYYIGGNNK